MKAQEKHCKNCNKPLTGRWKNYCSRRCGSLYYIKNNHKETDIEKKLREWLVSQGIQFKIQESISNITVPDFLIDKIAVFADGDYWHDKPRRKYLDQRINTRLEKLGYKVLRYKGSDILKNFETVTIDLTNNLCQAKVNPNNIYSEWLERTKKEK
jgi:very-short-patch-repair endonuclease